MHIVYLAEINNPHTQRWTAHFAGLGCRVTLLCDYPGSAPHPGINVIHPKWSLPAKILAFKIFPKPWGNNALKWLAYRPVIQALQPDLIHAMEALGYGYTMARAGDYPKLLTPWGNDVFYDPQKSRIARYLVKKALHSADVISTNMPTIDEYLNDEFDIPFDKVQAFSWGVDLNIFNPHNRVEAASEFKSRWKFPAGNSIIISARRFDPYWGAEEIIESIENVCRQRGDVSFVILRAGGDVDYFDEMAVVRLSELRLAGRVVCVPDYLSPEEMAFHLKASDAYISYPKTDLLAISLIEGMACGAVPIVANHAAYKERLPDDSRAYFAKPAKSYELTNAIFEYLNNRDKTDEICTLNWETVQREEDWVKQAQKMVGLYEDISGKSIP